MIDEDRTLSIYGYNIDELKPQSNKMIVAVCDECGMYRDLKKCNYRELCYLCSRTGENNPNYVKMPPKEELKKLYIDDCMIPKDISKIYNVSDVTVKNYLKKYNIPIRNNSEAQTGLHIGTKNHMYGKTGKDAPGFGKNGDKNPMFGKHHSEATKKLISKNSPHISGENHPAWKGGMSEWHDRLRRSAAYKNWRKEVFKRDDYTCQDCGDDKGGNLQAHHIIPIRDNKNTLLLLDINNGITLCKDCHTSVNKREYDFVKQFQKIVEDKNNA